MIKRIKATASILFVLSLLTACAATETGSAVDGVWDFTMSSPFGAVNATVTMATDGDSLTGTFDLGNGRTWSMDEGVANGNEISFSLDRDGSPMIYKMTATIEGDTATGSANAMGADVPWSMVRQN